ncbi:MAG: FAD-dependent oxidoreductase, partial [Pseudomonadota bacterium]
ARSFIRKIRFDNLSGAVRLLKRANVLAASCARICPTGALCCKECLAAGLSRQIDIAGLQRFVMDWELKSGMIEPAPSRKDGARVAVVGSGPAGLGCAAELAVRGHIVTVFEKSDKPGGILSNCIPSFRLPVEVVDFEIEFIKKLGVEFVCGSSVDGTKGLFGDGFKAVFLGAGLDKPRGGDIIGANIPGVHQAMDFLRAAKAGNVPELGSRVVVIGGGDTALDAARVARRSGAECLVLYRRTQPEMPAYRDEVIGAWDEGVEFYFRTVVRLIAGTDKVRGVKCVRIRWRPRVRGMPNGYDVEGSEFVIACDSVILAMGQGPASSWGLRTSPKGLVAVETETMMTSEKGVFAGGDLVLGGGTAARAVGQGKQAAVKIDEYVSRT